jgi:hypothetical protein
MELTLKNVLDDVRSVGSNGLQKEASQNEPAGSEKTSTAQQELMNALHRVVQSEKTAEATPAKDTSAVDTLVKMASDLAGTEQQALVKEAHLYGAAVADGFVARLNQYDQSLDAAGIKTASAEGEFVPSEEDFVKFAEANPDLVQQAMEQGYADTLQRIDQVKTAAAADVVLEKIASTPEGQAEIEILQKLASTEEGQTKLAGVEQGFMDAVEDITKLAQTDEGLQKLAEIKQGYEDTMGEVEKIASDCFSRGFQDTVNLIEKNIDA